MNRKLLTALTVLPLFYTTVAQANVYIGLEEAGVNGGVLTTVASGPNFAAFSGDYGPWFNVQNISITNFGEKLASTALDVLGTAARTLKIFVTSTDQTGLTPLQSALTSNQLPVGGQATLATYVDAGNGTFTTTTLLDQQTFNAIGTQSNVAAPALDEPYSVTGVYTLTSVAGNLEAFLDTIKVSAEPVAVREPSTLAILGAGLLAMGLTLRRRRT